MKKQFNEFDLHVILVLSDYYYENVASMNEMGAAWVLQKKYTTILLPGFEFKEIRGVINPRKIGLKLDNDSNDKCILLIDFSRCKVKSAYKKPNPSAPS